jgi:hypothetical protein
MPGRILYDYHMIHVCTHYFWLVMLNPQKPSAFQACGCALCGDLSCTGNGLAVIQLPQGPWCVQIGATVETFPASNSNYVRGLHYRFRLQIQYLQDERQALLQQLEDAPDGAALSSAVTSVKLTGLMDQNMALKEESAALVQEKVLLQDQMKQYKDSGRLFAETACEKRFLGVGLSCMI